MSEITEPRVAIATAPGISPTAPALQEFAHHHCQVMFAFMTKTSGDLSHAGATTPGPSSTVAASTSSQLCPPQVPRSWEHPTVHPKTSASLACLQNFNIPFNTNKINPKYAQIP